MQCQDINSAVDAVCVDKKNCLMDFSSANSHADILNTRCRHWYDQSL